MNRWLSDRLRLWILGSAATGLLIPSTAAFGQVRNAVSSSKKKPAVPQVVEPPQLLSVPSNGSQSTSEIELAAVEKSDVQRELEALYEQDGREMPNMNFGPMTPIPGAPNQQQGNSANPAAPAPQNQPRPVTQTQQPAAQPKQLPAQRPSAPGTMPWYVKNQINYTTRAESQPQYQNTATQYPPQAPQQSQPQAQQSQPQVQQQMQPQMQGQPPRYANLFQEDPVANAPQSYANQNAAPTPSPKPSFFRRLVGGGNTSAPKPLTSQAPLPPDFRDVAASPSMPPANGMNYPANPPVNVNLNLQQQANRPAAQQAQTTQAPPVAPARTTEAPNRIPAPWPKTSVPSVQTVVNNNPPTDVQRPQAQLPVLSQQAAPIQMAATQATLSLPPLSTEAHAPVQFASAGKKPALAPVNVALSDTPVELPSPTPVSADSETDSRNAMLHKRRDIPANAYVDDMNSKSKVANQTKPEANAVADNSEEDPFAVNAGEFAEPLAQTKPATQPATQPEAADAEFLPPVTAKNSETAAKPAVDEPTSVTKKGEDDFLRSLQAPPLEAPKAPIELAPNRVADSDEAQQLEKMRKIRERFGMKGLKGFCPVTLHDERELVDAKPEFYAIHRSQKFHFASAEARDRFEADPVKYAPAAYGADVVALFRDRDVVEGTLDHAAWFKGRLYLFGSQEDYEIFIDNPAKYATLSGIE